MWCDGEHSSVPVEQVEGGEALALAAVVLDTVPDEVELVILRETTEVLSQSFEFDPALYYPNGEACEPVCRSWEGTVDGW